MSKSKQKIFCLYKIYSDNCLLYVGRTKQPLQQRLHGHFFKKPMLREINIECVTKIEYALLPTEADLNLMEIYYINKLKPPLNRDDKAPDQLTIELPELEFQEYEYKLMDKWRKEIHERDELDAEKRRQKAQLELERQRKRREIFGCEDLTPEEKTEQYTWWLENYYEPIRNGLF